jgi:hypothetical protein
MKFALEILNRKLSSIGSGDPYTALLTLRDAGLDVNGIEGGLVLHCDDENLVATEGLLRTFGLRIRECLLRTSDEPIGMSGTVQDQARLANDQAIEICHILTNGHMWEG